MDNDVNDTTHQHPHSDKKPWSTPQVLTQSLKQQTLAKVGGTYETASHVIGPNSAS